MTDHRELLKTGPKRSVHLETRPAERTGSGPEKRIVKTFHGADLLDRFRDRRRARNEFELLGRLHARGLPVPRPLAVAQRDGRWEVATEYLPNAVPLDTWLRRSGELTATGLDVHAVLARELGSLVARLWDAGLDHRDLHPGNFLVREDGSAPRLWLIDLSKSRLRERVRPEQVRRDLTQLGAGVRELTEVATRRRFFIALLAALPSELRGTLPARAPLGRELEDAARLFRRRDIARRTRRWLRDSSSVEPFDDARGSGFLRRDVSPDFPVAVSAALESGRWLRRGTLEHEGHTAYIVEGDDWNELCDTWRAQVRLFTHGVPCLAPLCIARTPRPWLAVATDPEWRAIEPAAESSEPTRGASPSALGRLIGTLHDRLVTLTEWRPGAIWSDPDGGARFGVVHALRERGRPGPLPGAASTPGTSDPPGKPGAPGQRGLDRDEPGELLERWCGGWSAAERAAYAHGYANALRHSARERTELTPREGA